MTSTLPAPDRPGTYLSLVLHLAARRAPEWWDAADEQRRTALPQLALADEIARLAQRVQPVATPAEALAWPLPEITTATASGWLQPRPAPADQLLASPGWELAPAALRQIRVALAVATGGEPDAWTTLIRTGMGQLEVPAGTPLARLLAGEALTFSPLPWPARSAAEAWLDAQEARRTGPHPDLKAPLLAALRAGQGTALHLIHHHRTALHAWTRLGFAWAGSLPGSDPLRRELLRLLRRCPLEPRLAADLWTNLWRDYRLRPLGRRLAHQYQRWALWTASEQRRWRLRAAGTVQRAAEQVWEERSLRAWLSRDGQGHVLADGVRVEARALAHLRSQGWDGLHAEGWFWSVLVRRLALPLTLAPVPGAWVAPLQREPLDHGRWGWGRRRISYLAALTRDLLRDPVATIDAACTPEDDPALRATAHAVAQSIPPTVLNLLVRRLILHPDAAAGLPDLIVWRGDAVALWEVKSPGDALRDAQREWLHWARANGIAAGVWLIVGKELAQTSFLTPATPLTIAETPSPSRTRTTTPASAPTTLELAADWPPTTITADAPLPAAEAAWGTPATIRAWSAQEIPTGRSARPITRWILWQPRALLARRRSGRRLIEQRWHLLPAGWGIPLAESLEPATTGGLHRVVRLPLRHAGWWWPERFTHEPVLIPASQLTADPRSWAVYPDFPSLDPERQAHGAGRDAELDAVLACIGAEPHALHLTSGLAMVAVDPHLGVIWPSIRIERTVLSPDLLRGTPDSRTVETEWPST